MARRRANRGGEFTLATSDMVPSPAPVQPFEVLTPGERMEVLTDLALLRAHELLAAPISLEEAMADPLKLKLYLAIQAKGDAILGAVIRNWRGAAAAGGRTPAHQRCNPCQGRAGGEKDRGMSPADSASRLRLSSSIE